MLHERTTGTGDQREFVAVGTMNKWKRVLWGEVATLEYGKALRNYQSDIGAVPVYGTNGLIGWTNQTLYDFPSVIIGRKGAYRGVHFADRGFFVIDTAFYLKPKQLQDFELDTKWTYYCLLTYDINSMDSGSAIPSTSRDDFYKLPLFLPSLDEQCAIAAILSGFDDKIALNRRMNAALEATARALFQSWFVDFDPVRAKAEGRQPEGMDAETAALFPDSFEESALGWIPSGWEVMPLSAAIEINPTRRLVQGELAPYLAMQNMPTQSARPIDWVYREVGAGARFINGDVLLARITPCLENGKTAYVDFLEQGQTAWGSTEYIVFRSKPNLPIEYPYFLARSETLREYAIRSMSGTSGRQRVNASAFEHYYVTVPSIEIAAQFGIYVHDTFVKMKANDDESRTLAETRDALLPKLISGEVRVNEIRENL